MKGKKIGEDGLIIIFYALPRQGAPILPSTGGDKEEEDEDHPFTGIANLHLLLLTEAGLLLHEELKLRVTFNPFVRLLLQQFAKHNHHPSRKGMSQGYICCCFVSEKMTR